MPEELFDILFAGQLIDGQDPAAARVKVGQLFKTSEEQLDRLFSGKPKVIKKGVDLETASRYRLAFRKAGTLVDVRPSAVVAPTSPDDGQAAPELSLLPPNTGSLEEFAPRPRPQPLPDISALSLLADASRLDDTPDPEPAPIDTGGLDLVTGQDWTLEDCQPDILPLIMPDIDDLSLAAVDDESHIPAPPPPLPLPDIEALELEEPEPAPRAGDHPPL